MNYKLLSIIAVGAMLLTAFAAVDASAEDAGFDITDDTGKTVHFDGPAEHIAVNGTGAVLTIADAGAVDKIVAVDQYSTYERTGYEQLKDLDAINLGSFFYETNHDFIVTSLLNLVSEGKMTVNDPVILTGFAQNAALREILEEAGFTHVLVWMTQNITEYDDIVDFVEDLTMIATGERSESVQQMREKIEYVSSTVSQVPDGERAKAISVWYTSSTGSLMVNNIGIAGSMLELCNADNIGYREDGGSRYGDDNTVISILGENPGTIIFISDSYASSGKTAEDFRNEFLGGSTDYPIVLMGALWNNYCPESADGLILMAEALYPELFDAQGDDDTPSGDSTSDESGSDILLWVVALIVAIIIVVAAYAVFKRTHT